MLNRRVIQLLKIKRKLLIQLKELENKSENVKKYTKLLELKETLDNKIRFYYNDTQRKIAIDKEAYKLYITHMKEK